MSTQSFEAAVALFTVAYAEALEAGARMTPDQVIAMARDRAGEAAAPAALAEAARVADEVNGAAIALAGDARAEAAAETVTALHDWADVEHSTEALATSIAAIMTTPGMTPGDRREVDARADDLASTMSSQASLAASQNALELAIVSRAVAEAAVTVQNGVAADADNVVREVATTAARIRDDAVGAAAALYAASARADDGSSMDA